MHTSFLKPTLSLLLSLLFIPALELSGTTLVSADHSGSGSHQNVARRHHIARDVSHSNAVLTNTYNGTSQSLERRAAGAQMTYFVTGLGACGRFNAPADFIVALNKEQFDQGGACFKQITIRVGGKTAQAQIVDRCELCGWGNIDLTEGLFHFLGGTAQGGTLTGDWEYGSGGSPPPKPTSTPPPRRTTSSKPRVQPTSTPVSSTQATVSTSTSLTNIPASSTSAPVASPSDIVPADQAGNLAQLYLSYIGMASLALTSANQG